MWQAVAWRVRGLAGWVVWLVWLAGGQAGGRRRGSAERRRPTGALLGLALIRCGAALKERRREGGE